MLPAPPPRTLTWRLRKYVLAVPRAMVQATLERGASSNDQGDHRVYKGRLMQPVAASDTAGDSDSSLDLTRHLLDTSNAVSFPRSESLVKLYHTDSGTPIREALPSHHGPAGGSMASAVFNLATTSVGAGIMALPATMKVLGVPLGIISILFLGWLTDFSLSIIVRTSIAGSHRSYGQLMGGAAGGWGRFIAQVFVMVQAFGSLVVYLIITGDVLSGSTTGALDGQVHHQGILEEWAGGPTWWNARLPVLLVVLLCFLLPLASQPHIDSLMTSSAVSVALAVLFVLFTVGTCLLRIVRGTLDMPRLFPDLSTWRLAVQTFTTLPVMATAYICHYNVQPIYEELREKTEKNMCRVAYLSQLVVTIIYCGAATSSYLLFGNATASDVLANFDTDLGVPKVAADVVRLGYIAHLLLVFPIVHFPLRLTLDVMLFPRAVTPLSQDRARFAALTAGVLVLIFLCAIAVPDIYILFSFLGSVVSVSVGFTFPALIAIRFPNCVSCPWERGVAWFMLILGIFLTVTGFIAQTALL